MQDLKIEKAIRLMVGIMILASLILAFFVSKWWLGIAAFIGINLFQSGITGFCLLAIVFNKLGMKHK